MDFKSKEEVRFTNPRENSMTTNQMKAGIYVVSIVILVGLAGRRKMMMSTNIPPQESFLKHYDPPFQMKHKGDIPTSKVIFDTSTGEILAYYMIIDGKIHVFKFDQRRAEALYL